MRLARTHPTFVDTIIEEEYQDWHQDWDWQHRIIFFASWVVAVVTRGRWHISLV